MIGRSGRRSLHCLSLVGLVLVIIQFAACRAQSRSPSPTSVATEASALASSAPDPLPSVPPAEEPQTVTLPTLRAQQPPKPIEVILAGDVIPQPRVISADLARVFGSMPSFWRAADARIVNFEGSTGERRSVPHDHVTLAFAAPAEWLARFREASQATALVLANNHSCDLGTPGTEATLAAAKAAGVSAIGIAEADPLVPQVIAERDGKKICLVAWTTFVNEEKRFGDRCRMGRSTPRVARIPATSEGSGMLRRELGGGKLSGCAATIAYVHGGNEYRKQPQAMLSHVRQASEYVDAVVVSHPHVPEGLVTVVNRAGKSVPVFLSLGNFVSNQGVGYSAGMKDRDFLDDPIRNPWTRVSLLARLQFSFAENQLGLRYGYSSLFTDRTGPDSPPVLRELAAAKDDAVFSVLQHGALGELFRNPCWAPPDATNMPCTSQSNAAFAAGLTAPVLGKPGKAARVQVRH
jgi:Bacterial capsule synthesis protein PGA_cap